MSASVNRKARRQAKREVVHRGEGNAATAASRGAKLQSALRRHLGGELGPAAQAYQEILAEDPRNADALHLLGVIHLQTGRHEAALDLIGRALAERPADPDFAANYGAVLQKLGRLDEAVEQYRTALTLNPRNAGAYANMAAAQRKLGQLEAALESYLAVLRLGAAAPEVLKEIGDICIDLKDFARAWEHLQRYVAVMPTDAEGHNMLGHAVENLGRPDEAEAAYRRAAELQPEVAEFHSNVGLMAREQRRYGDAEAALRRAHELAPSNWRIASNLAGIWLDLGQPERCAELLRRLLAEHPNEPKMWNGLGLALGQTGDIEGAKSAFARAIELDPSSPEPRNNLALCHMNERHTEKAVETLRDALKHQPRNVSAHVNLCNALTVHRRLDEANLLAHATLTLEGYRPRHFATPLKVFRKTCDFGGIGSLGDVWAACDKLPPQQLPGVFLDMLVMAETPRENDELTRLHRKWGEAVAADAGRNPLPALPTGPRKGKIRIGLLSSDLRSHSVAKFMLPIIENCDRDRFEIFCYSPVGAPHDSVQNRIRGMVERFTVLEHVPIRDFAAAIRADDVDVLFELNGFTRDSRIGAIAYRPAPIQVSWIGYPFTSGLPQMDYIVLDRFLRPTRDGLLVETPLELPGPWACFGSLGDAPIADTLPCERNGFVTFGTLNNPYKYQPSAVALWAEVMRQVPNSRFLVVRSDDGSVLMCHNLVAEFAKHGISGDRLFFLPNAPGTHLQCYNEIDVSLDTFPLTGGTTTCDALWMGVPVVSLRGENFHQRLSHSYLNNAGVGELSCQSPAEYLQTALALAEDRERLRRLRHDLRPRLLETDLCRGDRFTAGFQDAVTELVHRHGLR